MFEVSSSFRCTCVFFGGYTGDTGFGFFQLHPANDESYVLIMERQPLYTLPRKKNDMQEPFKGLVKLLRIRAAVRSTIETYRRLYRAQHQVENVADQDQETEEPDVSWMTEDSVEVFDSTAIVASSPIDPDDHPPGSDGEDRT
ncbi:hypothetical protein BGW42_004519 [Actinomortierella wolfii]|nr:hypothetical protein BGW42_004519 [Actinomortierella wolfii]